MLAMCCRLLAKTKQGGEYVSLGRMREALECARKLYAQPQIPISELTSETSNKERKERHSALIYRRLAIELAVRTGDLEAAAEVLRMALECEGGSVDGFLFLPGIWDVLPLLNNGGRKNNPFFIEEQNANSMVQKISVTLELRAREGRQWSLSPEKVSWWELLERLRKGAWKVNRAEYKRLGVSYDDILHRPATEEEIKVAERRWGKLPRDFKEMVRVANG
jgi:hypothetical protein